MIFYQVIYIATIFKQCVGFPWSSHAMTSLPHFELDGYNIFETMNTFYSSLHELTTA